MEWAEVVDNPLLKELPFKIELNKWGNILMSPASNNHGIRQYEMVKLLQQKNSGQIIIECSIQTNEGVRVADVAWASDAFMGKHGDETPYTAAPEICIEVLSPSNSMEEMNEKIRLYFEKGALEVWLCGKNGEISYYDANGHIAARDSG
jgi:Uma2 family endonuclease